MPRDPRSHGFAAGHAELDEFRIQPAAALAADPDFQRARVLAPLGGVGRAPGDGADEQKDPPEAHQPSTDSGEDPSNHEQDDRAEKRLEERHDGERRAHRGADRAYEESEERVEDYHDAYDREDRAHEEHGDGAPSEREGRWGPRDGPGGIGGGKGHGKRDLERPDDPRDESTVPGQINVSDVFPGVGFIGRGSGLRASSRPD